MDIIHKSGSWFTYKDYRWHGMTEVRDTYNNEPDFKKEIQDLVNNNSTEPEDEIFDDDVDLDIDFE
jgi:hypothetical protein